MLNLIILCLTFSYFLMGGVFAAIGALIALEHDEGGVLIPLVFLAWPVMKWPVALFFMVGLEAALFMTWVAYMMLKIT